MTVKELIKDLKQFPPDAVVVRCDDWETCDEFGRLKTTELDFDITSQTIVDCNGLQDIEFMEVILY